MNLQQLKHSESLMISVGTTSTIGIHFLPSIISGFITANPEMDFQFHYQPKEILLQNIKGQAYDFYFYDTIDFKAPSENIETLSICNVENVLIVPKSHPLAKETEVSLRDLKDESFVSSCKLTKEELNSFESFLGYSPRIVMQASETNMVEGLVAAGVGIAIVPDTPLMNTNIFSKVKLKDASFSRTIYMAWNKTTAVSDAARSFLHYIKTTFSSSL